MVVSIHGCFYCYVDFIPEAFNDFLKKKKNLIIRNLGIKENHWLKCKRANLSSDYISSKQSIYANFVN